MIIDILIIMNSNFKFNMNMIVIDNIKDTLIYQYEFMNIKFNINSIKFNINIVIYQQAVTKV